MTPTLAISESSTTFPKLKNGKLFPLDHVCTLIRYIKYCDENIPLKYVE